MSFMMSNVQFFINIVKYSLPYFKIYDLVFGVTPITSSRIDVQWSSYFKPVHPKSHEEIVKFNAI